MVVSIQYKHLQKYLENNIFKFKTYTQSQEMGREN